MASSVTITDEELQRQIQSAFSDLTVMELAQVFLNKFRIRKRIINGVLHVAAGDVVSEVEKFELPRDATRLQLKDKRVNSVTKAIRLVKGHNIPSEMFYEMSRGIVAISIKHIGTLMQYLNGPVAERFRSLRSRDLENLDTGSVRGVVSVLKNSVGEGNVFDAKKEQYRLDYQEYPAPASSLMLSSDNANYMKSSFLHALNNEMDQVSENTQEIRERQLKIAGEDLDRAVLLYTRNKRKSNDESTRPTKYRYGDKERSIESKLLMAVDRGFIPPFVKGRKLPNTYAIPDFLFQREKYVIVLEVDEHQHVTYNWDGEAIRELRILKAMNDLPLVIVRYNPDMSKGPGSASAGVLMAQSREDILLSHLAHMFEMYDANPPSHKITRSLVFFNCSCTNSQNCNFIHTKTWANEREFLEDRIGLSFLIGEPL